MKPMKMHNKGPSLKRMARSVETKPRETVATLGRMLGYLWPYRSTLLASIGFVVGSSAATAMIPWLTGRVVDVAVSAREVGALTLPMLALIAANVAGWIMQRLQILTLGSIGQYALVNVRRQVFEKIHQLSVAFFEVTESGDLMSRLVNDVETLNSFLSQGFRRVLGSGVGLVATLAGMLLVDTRLAVATLTVVPLLYLTTRLFSAIARRAFRRTREAIGDVSSTLAEELSGIRVAQAFDRTDMNLTEFDARNAANRDANITATAVSSAFTPTLAVLSALLTAIVAGYGGWLVAEGAASIGVVVAFFAYARTFFNTLSQLSSLYADMQSAVAGAERVFDLLDTPPDIEDAPDAVDLADVRGRVDYDHVDFRYGVGPEVLRDIDLHVEAGTTLAIVGETGAGKSTLVNLLGRFYDPVAGTVRVDGHDLRQVSIGSLRRRLGIVLQDPFLFSGTIAENIRYGRLEATDEEVRAAAETAHAIGFIERLPDGFETQVGERGGMLSTGQRQLVAFARAVLADPAILILDEATSSVDTRTESLIQDALDRLLSGRTAFVIAHRLSTVRNADRIVVMDHGRVVEEGTYDELLALGGAFARLHDAQFVD